MGELRMCAKAVRSGKRALFVRDHLYNSRRDGARKTLSLL